ESFESVRQTADRSYILAGVSRSPASGNMEPLDFAIWDGWLVKVDAEGNKEWERLFGGTEFDSFFSLDQTDDGGFILGGRSQSRNSSLQVYWLVEVDKAGHKEWERSYDLKQGNFLPNVRRTADQGYIFNG